MDEKQTISAHEQRELEKKQKEEQRAKEIKKAEMKKNSKKLAGWGVLILLIAGFFYWIYSTAGPAQQPFAVGNPIHWHAKLDIQTCGKVRDDVLKLGAVNHAGASMLHTHGDNIIHVETNIIYKAEDIALGKFFDAINLNFDKDKLLDKKNGDLCDGKPAQVKMWVNGKENKLFRDFIPTDGDEIKLSFE